VFAHLRRLNLDFFCLEVKIVAFYFVLWAYTYNWLIISVYAGYVIEIGAYFHSILAACVCFVFDALDKLL